MQFLLVILSRVRFIEVTSPNVTNVTNGRADRFTAEVLTTARAGPAKLNVLLCDGSSWAIGELRVARPQKAPRDSHNPLVNQWLACEFAAVSERAQAAAQASVMQARIEERERTKPAGDFAYALADIRRRAAAGITNARGDAFAAPDSE